MTTIHSMLHLIFPRHTNNYKAKLIQSSSLIVFALLLVFVHMALRLASSPGVKILGYAANISPQKVVELTNQKRLEAGVSELRFNAELAHAARLKALDMLEQDYWAHVSPSGTEPWDFFRMVGYVYRFAGENLARDFTNPNETVEAWLASPSHRENMLSGKYNEIGVAVVEGDLNGEDTTLIVQLFGTKSGEAPTIPVAAAEAPTPATPGPELARIPQPVVNAAHAAPVVSASRFDIMRSVTLGVMFILALVLAFDVVIVAKKGVTRVGGRAFAHLSFMAMVLIILIIVKAGEII